MSKMLDLYRDIEMPLLPILADMEMRGAYVSTDKVQQLEQLFLEEQAKLPAELEPYIDEPINLNSREDVSILLFEQLRLTPPGDLSKITTTKGFISTNTKNVLDEMDHHPVIETVKEHRKFQKLLGYCKSLAEPHLLSGRVHTNFNQAKVRTGRLSSSNPINFQNIPARTDHGKLLRGCFQAPPNYVIVKGDYDQMELRGQASFSGDPVKLEIYARDGDLHQETSDYAFSDELDYAEHGDYYRKISKNGNFLSIYRGGPANLARTISKPFEFAAEFQRAQKALFPQSEIDFYEYCEHLQEQGYAETIMGRRRYLAGVNSLQEWVREDAFRKGYSLRIQGSCADIMKRAMLRLQRTIDEKKLRAYMIIQVHDEVVLECHPEDVGALWEAFQVFTDVPEFNVKMPVTVEVGPDWLNTTEVESPEEAYEVAKTCK